MGVFTSSFATNSSSQTWLTSSSDGAYWISSNARTFIAPVTGETKLIGVAGFSNTSLGSSVAIGVSGAIICNNVAKAGWAAYLDVQYESGTYAYGVEIAVKNKSLDKTVTPYTADPSGSTFGVQLSGGGDNNYGGAGANPVTAGIIFTQAGNTWNRGIVFRKTSITGTDGSTGTGVAIEMAKGHLVQWENQSNVVANIGTDGTGADLDIMFTPGGAGKVKFGAHSSLAAETVTGYITIKDSGGTLRKLAVVS